MKKFSNLPNILTLFRILLIVPVVIFMHFDNQICSLIAGLLFSVASITDLLDGYFARKLNLITSFGKFIDPLADKLMILSVFIMLVKLNRIPPWIAIVILSREFLITGLRAMAATEGIVISADKLGKNKTIFQITALIALIIYYPFFGLNSKAIGYFFLIIALITTVWSGINYIKNFFYLLSKDVNQNKSE